MMDVSRSQLFQTTLQQLINKKMQVSPLFPRRLLHVFKLMFPDASPDDSSGRNLDSVAYLSFGWRKREKSCTTSNKVVDWVVEP